MKFVVGSAQTFYPTNRIYVSLLTMKTKGVRRFWWISILFVLASGFASAETIICSQRIEAFDSENPSQILGYFDANSSLELEEFVASAKMYRVRYKTPDGKEIVALCKPEALGKNVPLSPRMTTYAEDSSLPPLFQQLLKLDSALWSIEPSKFAMYQSRFGFQWVSSLDQTTSRSGQPLTFMGLPVYETIARFKNADKKAGSDASLEEVMLLLYGRGDVKEDLGEDDFQAFLNRVEGSLNEWTSGKGIEAAVKTTDKDLKRKSWFKYPIRVDLDWSTTRNAKELSMAGIIKTKFRGEFIRLTVSPYDGQQRIADLVRPNYQVSNAAPIKLKDLKERIQRESNGDVYLKDIPMVNQGQKSYCVAASMERMMRYYGLDIDQNEMAKVANTSNRGTSPDDMFFALKKIGGRFSMAVRELKHFSIKGFQEEIKDYNNLARREKARQIQIPQYGMIDLAAIYNEMDPKILKGVYQKNLGDKNKFVRDITDMIDRGAPIFWSVLLGFIPETPPLPQEKGGHMRLIIGYNFKDSNKAEIIYTDSWGADHAFKRMSVDNAFFITRGLYSVLPSS